MRRSAVLAAIVLAAAVSAPARAQIAIPEQADPLLTGLAIPADAPTRGMWSPVQPWPLVGLHTVLLPTVVLSYGTPLGRGVQDGRTFDIWDPSRGLVAQSHLTLPNAQAVDSFCAASG